MKSSVCLTAFVTVSTLFVASSFGATQFEVSLDGSQENPPLASAGTGSGTLTLVDLGGGDFRWDYDLTFSTDLDFSNVAGIASNGGSIEVTNFHVHNEVRGVNGGVVYGIFAPDQDNDDDVVAVLNADNTTTITGGWGPADGNPVGGINTFAPSLLAAGPGDVDFYFNVHSTVNGGGEIRGQIEAVPEPASGATLIVAVLLLQGCRRRRTQPPVLPQPSRSI